MLDGFTKWEFGARTSNGDPILHDIYERGDGPPVLLVQELPGIGPSTLTLADNLAHAGFKVVLPHLFGPLGEISMLGNMARVFCLRKEFTLFSKNSSSPIVDWLKALCQRVRERDGVEGVGVIGMCLTGNFAISLMADDAVLAGVASQPSMPLFSNHRELHMSQQEIDGARDKLDDVGPMLAYRFAGDKICKAEKFESLQRVFNDDNERIRLKTLDGPGHSVLTLDFVAGDGSPTQAALDEVVAYFHERLDP